MAKADLDLPTTVFQRRLADHHLRLAGLEVVDESEASPPAPCRMTPLLEYGWLAVNGPDAISFMHAQLSAEVAHLPPNQWSAAAYCSPQGRVLGVMRMVRDDDSVLLTLPQGLCKSTAERLRMFVLRGQVEVTPRRDMTALGVWGEGAAACLGRAGLPVPEEPMSVNRAADLQLWHLPGEVPRYLVAGAADALAGLWDRSLTHASPAGTEAWRREEIAAGWPGIRPETSDKFLPQSLNLAAWHGLSFSKGCYPGQEIIARMQYRGRLKLHLYRAQTSAPPPAPGTEITFSDGSRAGQVLYAAKDAGSTRLLAVLRGSESDDYRMIGGEVLRAVERVRE